MLSQITELLNEALTKRCEIRLQIVTYDKSIPEVSLKVGDGRG